MTRKAYPYLIILSILILISCDKEDEITTISGIISEYYTNKGIDNYYIGLSEHKNFSIFSPDKIVDTIYTNKTGSYKYSFKNKEGYNYQLVYLDNTYSKFESKNIHINKNNIINIKVKDFNTLRLEFKKEINNYEKISIIDYSNDFNIYNSIFIDSIVIYDRLVPDELLKLKIYLYNTQIFEEGNKIIDTNIYIHNEDTIDFVFKH